MKKSLVLFFFGCLLLLAGCTGLEALDFITPTTGYRVFKNIAYGGDKRQQLDVYVPLSPAPGNPVLVFFYGGSWQTGSKNDYRFVAQAFASKGFYTVLADYRLYPDVYFPAFMHDGAEALAWAHHHIAEFGGNPDNLFVSGHSSGAYIAILLALDDRYVKQAGGTGKWIKGGIGIAGPYDFLPFTDPNIKAIFSKVDDIDSQPITYVKSGAPPLLLLTGDSDHEVYPKNSLHLAAKLKQYGDPVELHVYPGLAHKGIVLALASGFRGKAPTLEDIATFVRARSHK